MFKFLLCIMFNYNIYNQANECSVKVDVWICLTSFTKTIETKCEIAISLFFLNVYITVFLHVPICYTVYMV